MELNMVRSQSHLYISSRCSKLESGHCEFTSMHNFGLTKRMKPAPYQEASTSLTNISLGAECGLDIWEFIFMQTGASVSRRDTTIMV